MKVWLALCLLAGTIGSVFAQGAQHAEPGGDELLAHFDPRGAVGVIDETVRQHGGAPETQSIHLVLGFSTGNANTDPVRARALRELGQQILNAFLVPGDTLTIVAFERDVWKTEPERQFRSEDRKDLWDAWPKTPMPGSIGGTDYNTTLISVLKELPNTSRGDYVIVLLGPFESSVESPKAHGERPMSDNGPELLAALKTAGCTPLTAHEFSYEQPNLAGRRSVWMQIATPVTFAGTPLAGGTRAEYLARRRGWVPVDDPYQATVQTANSPDQSQASPAKPQVAASRSDGTAILFGLVVVVAIVFMLYRAFRPRSAATLTITLPDENGASRPFAGPFKRNDLVARLVGAGFPEPQPNDVTISRPNSVPAVVLMEIRGEGRDVRLVPKAAGVTVGTTQVGSSLGWRLPAGTARPLKVKLVGRSQPADGQPALPYSVDLEVKLI